MQLHFSNSTTLPWFFAYEIAVPGGFGARFLLFFCLRHLMLRRRYVYATLLLCFCHVDATLGMGGRGGHVNVRLHLLRNLMLR